MREMKDSGIEWIGEIPQSWSIVRGKYILKYLQKPIKETDGVITCFRDGEVTLRSNRREDGFTISEKEIGYQGVDVGDLVVHGMDGFAGAIGVSDARGKASPVLNILDSNQNKRYLMYYLRSMAYGNVFVALASGIRVRSCDLRWNKLAELPYPTTERDEQKQIADFLDSKCSEIDAIATDIQKEITVLEKYKKSVITEAVTKGLNPNVEMKDSGIAWIGKIPKHWNAVNPRWLFSQRKDRAKKGMEQYTASQKYGIISQKEYMRLIGGNIVTVQKDFDILKMVCKGDFVIHMRSFQGGLEYSEKTGSISSAYVMLIPQKAAGEHRYFKWLFKSDAYINALQSTSNLIRDGQAMRYSNFIKITIPHPPLNEQKQIADFLDSKCTEIDATISDKQKQLEVLADYKKSLIYEYVTGKKEVPSHE